MKNSNERKVLEKVITLIQKNKAQGDVIFTRANTFSLKAHQGELDKYEVNNGATIGVRVIKDNKVGQAFSEALDDDSLQFMVNEALTNAKYSKENLFEKISAPKKEVINNDVLQATDADPKKMIDLCLENENYMLSIDKRIKNSPYNGVAEIYNQFLYLNTNGTYCERQDKYYRIVCSALIEDNQNNSSVYDYTTAKKFSDLQFKEMCEACAKEGLELLEGKEIPTGRYNIVFNNESLSSILAPFLGMFSGEKAVRGLNPMKEKLGEKIASDLITIIDDPKFEEAYYKYDFDHEGNSTHKVTLLNSGVFEELLQNSATANELEMKNNGRANRSPKSALGVTTTNLIIESGETSEEVLQKEEYLEIVDIQGTHSGTNFFSGNFSCPVKGHIWKNGQKTGQFKNVTLTGNFYDMIKNVKMVGNKLYSNPSNTFFAPKIIFSDLNISGS